MDIDNAEVIYPGARVDLFGAARLGRPLPEAPGTVPPSASVFRRIAMGSKGRTLLEALLQLKRGLKIHAMLAGGAFRKTI